MPIINKFLSGAQKRNRGHFASIVKIARANDSFSKGEKQLLRRLKKELNINEVAFRKILRRPDSYAMLPPSDYEERIERLWDLATMLLADDSNQNLSLKIVEKLAIGLGFTLDKYQLVVTRALELVKEKVDEDTFSKEIRKVNGL